MKNARLARKNRTRDARSWERLYEATVERKIRARYSVSAELAILRQKDTKPAEFEAYNAYAEACKAEAKAELEPEVTEP
jgi:hypothetical protein